MIILNQGQSMLESAIEVINNSEEFRPYYRKDYIEVNVINRTIKSYRDRPMNYNLDSYIVKQGDTSDTKINNSEELIEALIKIDQKYTKCLLNNVYILKDLLKMPLALKPDEFFNIFSDLVDTNNHEYYELRYDGRYLWSLLTRLKNDINASDNRCIQFAISAAAKSILNDSLYDPKFKNKDSDVFIKSLLCYYEFDSYSDVQIVEDFLEEKIDLKDIDHLFSCIKFLSCVTDNHNKFNFKPFTKKIFNQLSDHLFSEFEKEQSYSKFKKINDLRKSKYKFILEYVYYL